VKNSFRLFLQNEANLVTPRNGELIISATQDFLTGAYLMTWKNAFFTRPEACRLIGAIAATAKEWIYLPVPAILKPVQLWTGKQLMSLVFRPNRHSKIELNVRAKGKNYTGREEEMDPNDTCKRFPVSD